MVQRKQGLVDPKIYVATFLVSLLIFVSGLLVGMTLENERQKELTKLFFEYTEDIETTYVQSLLITQGNVSCGIYPAILSKSYKDLDDLGSKLSMYQEQGRFSDPEFNALKNRYMTLSVRTWLYLGVIRKYCPHEYVNVLYFYSTKDCSDCIAQGVVLDDLKKEYRMKLLTFSLDAEYQHPIVESLVRTYNITQTPSIVIGDTVLSGLYNKTQLMGILCKYLEDFC